MNKPHTTLRLSTNLVLILVWMTCAAFFAVISDSLPILQIAAGCTLGAIGGFMQLASFKEGGEKYLQAKTAIEVRMQLKGTKWGKRSIYFLWSAGAMLAVLSFFTSNNPMFAFPSSYFGLMFTREIITIKAILAT